MTDAYNAPAEPIGSELLRDDPSFADIVLQFVEGLGNRITTMEDAMRAADFEALRQAAHQLKGSGGGYGYPLLTERAADLERLAKSQELQRCAGALDTLKQVAARVVVGEGA